MTVGAAAGDAIPPSAEVIEGRIAELSQLFNAMPIRADRRL